MKRGESVSVCVMFNENIKLVIDSELVRVGEFPSWKQLGRTLQKINNNLYEEVIEIQKSGDYVAIKTSNKKLEQHLIQTLRSNGFTEEEINHWENCNLGRIIFQYQ